MADRGRAKLRSAVRKTGASASLAAVFALSAAGGVALHISLPPARRLVTRVALGALNQAISGRITAESVDKLALTHLEFRGVTISDPSGKAVIRANRLEARVASLGLLNSLVFGKGDIELRIPTARADEIVVDLEQDSSGVLTLVRTFEPRPRPPAPPGPPSAKPARKLVLDMPHIEIGSLYAQGNLASVGVIDAESRTIHGALHVGPDGVSIDTERSAVAIRKPLPLPTTGSAEFHLRSPGAVWGYFAGMVGEIELTSGVKLDGNMFDATVDVPALKGETLAAWVPQTKVAHPIAMRVEAHGQFPTLQTSASVTMGSTQLEARGPLKTSSPPGADLQADLRDLNLRNVLADAPTTQLGGNGRVEVAIASDGQVKATVTGTVQPGSIATVSFPRTDFTAVVDRSGVQGKAQVHEPGMPIDAGFGVTRAGLVTIHATTKIASIDAAPRLAHVVKGRATAKLDASIDQGNIDAVLSADLQDVSRDSVALRSGRLNAHAWGKPDQLQMDVSLAGRGVQAGALAWKDGVVVLRGPVRSPQVTVTLRDDVAPLIVSKASLSVGKQVGAHNVHVEVGEGNQGFSLNAETVEVRDGTVDFGGIAIDGLGSPVDGVVKVGPHGFDVRLVSSGINLAKLSRVLALPGHQLAGSAAIDIDVRNSGSESVGCARIDVRGGRVDMITGVETSVRARFSGSHVEFDSNLAIGADGTAPKPPEGASACLPAAPVAPGALVAARFGGDVTLHGSPMRVQAWKDATGTARLNDLIVDLDRLGSLARIARKFAPNLNLPELKGTVQVAGEVARDKPQGAPSWSVLASTHQFEWKSSDVAIAKADAVASASMESSGLLRTSACLRKTTTGRLAATCRQGEILAAATANTNINYDALLQAPSLWRDRWRESQTIAQVAVPDQSISNLLAPFMDADASPLQSDHISARIDLSGTPISPKIQVQGYVDRPQIGDETVPAMVCLAGNYDGAQGALTALLRRRVTSGSEGVRGFCSNDSAQGTKASEAQAVGIVQSSFRAKWADVLTSKSASEIPLEADATFKLDNLPLADLGDGVITGSVSGSGGIAGLGRKPEFGASLDVQGLKVGSDLAYDRGTISLYSDERGLRGALDFIDNTRTREQGAPGRLEAEVKSVAPVRFAAGWIPGLDPGQEFKFRVKPGRFRISSLLPLVEPALSYLEGDVSGFLDATYVHGTNQSRVDDAFLSLSNGSFQIPTVGQEFINVSAVLRTTSPNQLTVEGFRANALSGSVAGSAAIGLDGLRIARVTGALATNAQNKIRLTIEGVPLGDVYGQVNADITLGAERNDVQLKISGVHVELTEAEQRKVQALDANPDVKVVPAATLAERGGGWSQTNSTQAARGKAAITPWRVTIGIADPVRLQRSGMRLAVMTLPDGKLAPTLDYPGPSGGSVALHGQVRLDEGRIDVVGKFFTIEPDRSLVTFDGDPGNPELNVTARWDGPDGTRVYADVTGTIKAPHVQLRSDPARPSSEILAMILFGGTNTQDASRRDGSRTGGGSGAAAAGVGSGVAAVGINRLLADVAPMGISTRIDTSQTQNVRPTVVIEVANNVTAEATVNTGAVPLGQNPDRYLLTLDWRFLKKWSLRTTVGDAGSSILDVLWTHRY